MDTDIYVRVHVCCMYMYVVCTIGVCIHVYGKSTSKYVYTVSIEPVGETGK